MRIFWALGRYDGVKISEAPSEKDVMEILIPIFDQLAIEMMVVIPREEEIKLM